MGSSQESHCTLAMSGASHLEYYLYTASIAAAAMFVAIFGVSALLNCLRGTRIRTWYMVLLVIGGARETIWYIVNLCAWG